MTDINTFGAVMSFAIELESKLRDYYQAAGSAEKSAASEKRRQTLERVRRENVTEIKLEPINDLHEETYALNTSDTGDAGQKAAARTAAQFYQDAAPKINVREAQRALERCGKAHAENAL
ncbi:MAG: hypothetical protein U0670_01820 [Anaerolineae bacterium]